MLHLLRLVGVIALFTPQFNAKVTSVFPCVWQDEESGDRLDLQFLKSTLLSNHSSNLINTTYSPCSNKISYNGSWYMAITTYHSSTQPLAKWDDGVTVPTYDSLRGNWNFYYQNVECFSNHSLQMSVNITWSYGDMNNVNSLTPNISLNPYNGRCSYSFTTQSVSTYIDNCSLPFYAKNAKNDPYISAYADISVFRSYIFDAAPLHSSQRILYSPCNDAIECDDNFVQATQTGLNQTNCTYLSLYAGFGATYSHTTHNSQYYTRYWNNNQYYDYNTITDTQSIEILYKTGQSCFVSESEAIERRFYVYWQCNTLAKPYANVVATADVVCTETLSIDSIYACPGFKECIYFDQGHTLNLTDLMGTYIFTQNRNNVSSWFYYSVCQNGLAQTMNIAKVSQPTTLYSPFSGGFMSGIYSGPQTVGDHNSFTDARIASTMSADERVAKYYYDSEINVWIFQYTNGRLCNIDSLFTVQWNCGGAVPSYLVSYTETPCAVSLVIHTNLC